MLDFSDAPYQFFPAKPKRSVQWLLKQANRRMFLPGPNHRIRQLELSGGERLQKLASSGARILIVANHPTHSDPQVITEVQRRMKIKSCFMAAYDVFLRGRGSAWFMQGNGAFSIDRETERIPSDLSSHGCSYPGPARGRARREHRAPRAIHMQYPPANASRQNGTHTLASRQ